MEISHPPSQFLFVHFVFVNIIFLFRAELFCSRSFSILFFAKTTRTSLTRVCSRVRELAHSRGALLLSLNNIFHPLPTFRLLPRPFPVIAHDSSAALEHFSQLELCAEKFLLTLQNEKGLRAVERKLAINFK